MHFSLEVNPKLGRRPALDGLRGLAVIGVMLFHSGLKVLLPGGSLGVDVFFVLSGFLITTLLLQEWASKGNIALGRFYVRRALRLLPAMLLLVAIYTLFVSATRGLDGDALLRVVAAVTYWFNWLTALNHLPNDELSPLWSLAVEEQFYLVWPGLLLVLLKLRCSPAAIMLITACLIALSASMPLWADVSYKRLYFSTEYRLHELMVGSLLAQLYVAGVVRRETVQTAGFKLLLCASALAMAWWLVSLQDRPGFMFSGRYFLVAICSAVIVLACAYVTGGRFAGVMSNRVLTYTGSRSYALYLWHIPIAVWLPPMNALLLIPVAIALSFVVAELSHRLVEAPALRLKDRLSDEEKTAATEALVGSAASARLRRLKLWLPRPNLEPAG